MQPHEEKKVTFMDWAVAQHTVCNKVLEKINALVNLSEAERCLEAA